MNPSNPGDYRSFNLRHGLVGFSGVLEDAQTQLAAGMACDFRLSVRLCYDGLITGIHCEDRWDVIHRFSPGRPQELRLDRL